ncbi:signal-induced proliferation-associated 1-like protein 2 isoform X2 [Mugil cephalus]|uniref:signal-induced proliferation-associated 1-like protein 2 isoform X2 n=1 Tax=Mugil cephalus TaxID=48193 RepID=UPI001FB6DF02|nr:signal-induced proliferation-associated 1-like protein 2 isoform X2 [Mugil cephalus]
MGPPMVHGTPSVPKMGVRVRMCDQSRRRDIQDTQPKQVHESLTPSFLNNESLDLQPGSETRSPLCDLWTSSSRRGLGRMKRSNSEQMMSMSGGEDMDSGPVNPNTGSCLRREYSSTWTLNQQTSTETRTTSLQAAAQIAQGDVSFIPGRDSLGESDKKLIQNMEAEETQRHDGRSMLTSSKCFSHYDVQSILFNIRDCSSSTREEPDIWFNLSEDRLCSFYCDDETEGGAERMPGQTCSNALFSSGCTNAAVTVPEFCRGTQNYMKNYDIEHIDLGAKYYLQFFYNRDHQNYFGIDRNFGPVSLSIRREKLEDGQDRTQYNYRIILRTTQLFTLRGSILEDSVPSSSKHRTSRGLPLRDVLEFVVPDLDIQCLRLATDSPRVSEMLLQLDQQEVNFQRKVDVLFHRPGRTADEELGSPALDQFLDLLGNKFPHGHSTGSHSVSTTFREFELMFRVSTLQPNNSHQVRHIQNNNNHVTVIFQEPDCPPFIPQNTCSHLQNVFIVVRVHEPCSQHTRYSVSVSRLRDVPPFGPTIPSGLKSPPSPVFRDFLLTKIINAEHAVRRSNTFVAMATRRRQEHLREMVENFATSTPVDSSSSSSSPRFSFLPLGRKKKKKKKEVCSPLRPRSHLLSTGALTWTVTAPGLGRSASACCRLVISRELVALIEEASRRVVFSCCCRDVIGWSNVPGGVKLFYLDGRYLVFFTLEGNWEDGGEITQRLQLVTRGSPALNMSLRRNRLGQLGFLVSVEAVVGDVEALGPAWLAGLRPGCRLMEICAVATVTLSHKQRLELLRTSETVDLLVLPPHGDGTPRRSFSETSRVSAFESKFSDIMTPPPWQQASKAPPPCSPPSNQNETLERKQRLSSSSDQQNGSRAPSDWSDVSDESPKESTWTTSYDDVSHHPHPVMKEFQQRRWQLTEKSREDRRYVSMDTDGVSIDTGTDSSIPSAPSTVAAATLVLRDIWRETPTSGITVATAAGHVTNLSASDLRLSCCEKSVSAFTPSPWRPLPRTLSLDNLCRTLSLSSSDQLLTRAGRDSSKLQRSELHYSDSSLAEGSTLAERGPLPLLEAPSHLDWAQPMDAAPVFEEDDPRHHTQDGTPALQDRDVPDASLSGKVLKLEEILHRLQLNLMKEQQDKAALQEQVLSLHQVNRRLEEARQSAAGQTRRLHRGTAAAMATRKSSI